MNFYPSFGSWFPVFGVIYQQIEKEREKSFRFISSFAGRFYVRIDRSRTRRRGKDDSCRKIGRLSNRRVTSLSLSIRGFFPAAAGEPFIIIRNFPPSTKESIIEETRAPVHGPFASCISDISHIMFAILAHKKPFYFERSLIRYNRREGFLFQFPE